LMPEKHTLLGSADLQSLPILHCSGTTVEDFSTLRYYIPIPKQIMNN
jgi:hypothetical protein